MIRFANRKCPRWFVAKCSSSPACVRTREGPRLMTPALLMRASIVCAAGSSHPNNSEAAVRMESEDARSSSKALVGTLGEEAERDEMAWWRLGRERPARMRRRGCWEAIARAVAMPRPLGETPVMRTREGVRVLEGRGLRKGRGCTCFPTDILRECGCYLGCFCALAEGGVGCHCVSMESVFLG